VIGLRIDWVLQIICAVITGLVIGAYFVEEHYRKKRDKDGH
jgi:uncharacterized protein YneF (UPF0154 family)